MKKKFNLLALPLQRGSRKSYVVVVLTLGVIALNLAGCFGIKRPIKSTLKGRLPVYFRCTVAYSRAKKHFKISEKQAAEIVEKHIGEKEDPEQNDQRPSLIRNLPKWHMRPPDAVIGKCYFFAARPWKSSMPLTGYYVNGCTGELTYKVVRASEPYPIKTLKK